MTGAISALMPKRLIVDANVLLAECMRSRGRRRLYEMDPELLTTERVQSEFRHELERRLDGVRVQGRLSSEALESLRSDALAAYEQNVSVVLKEGYAHFEDAALICVPQDPDDVPTAALALALNAGVWTEDRHFWGCGLPVWRTDVLYAALDQDAVLGQDNTP